MGEVRWEPWSGERYYYVGIMGNILMASWGELPALDKERQSVGNLYPTAGIAEDCKMKHLKDVKL